MDATTTSADHTANGGDHDEGGMSGSYVRFGLMIATSTAVMLMLTYTNIYAWSHIHWSEERLYMAVLMGSAMAIVMLGFMWKMYRQTATKLAVIAGAVAIGICALALSRTQQFVDDESYMKAMIPHHSIAILTSENADIDDVRVRQLADEIIVSQRREIKEMEWLLKDIDANGEAASEADAQARPVPDFEAKP